MKNLLMLGYLTMTLCTLMYFGGEISLACLTYIVYLSKTIPIIMYFTLTLFIDLKLSNIVCESKTCITVHTVQIIPGRSFRENENKEQISAENNGSSEIILSVVVSG